MAVGAVVMNRVRSGAYPNTIAEVIYQPGQFGPAMTGWLDSVLQAEDIQIPPCRRQQMHWQAAIRSETACLLAMETGGSR